MKKIVIRVLATAAVVVLAGAGYHFIRTIATGQPEIATAKVRRGDVVVRAFTRGELRAVRSIMLTAPNLFGTVQVTRLAPLGSLARRGDLVVEFDDAELQSRLEEKQLQLEQTEEQIKKAEADLAVRSNQDQVELLQARYTVRRAELEVRRNELLADIDRKKNNLNLSEAKQRLQKLKSDIQSRRQQARAQLAVLRATKRKSELELEREQRRLEQVRLLAPMRGLVAIRQARTHFFFASTQMPDIRVGDELRPGMPVADILDLSEFEVVARVGELDRANLKEGQNVIIRLDALSNKGIRGKIKSLSGTATANIYSNDPAKKFDVVFDIDMRQLLTALGARKGQIDQIMAQAAAARRRAAARPARATSVLAAMGEMPALGDSGTPGRMGRGAPGMRRSRRGRRLGLFDPAKLLSRLPEKQRNKAQETLNKGLKGKKWAALSRTEKRSLLRKLRPLLPGPRGGSPNSAGNPRLGLLQFSKAQIAAAKLPPAPEQDNQLGVLLRPGLLADVEIIVEKIPNAIYIPDQAVFEKDNRPMVYVKTGNRFEERFVKPLKRSEATMVIKEGLKEGEVVALANPNAKAGKSGAARGEGAMKSFGGSGGGRRGRRSR